jgi:hypothetical protein
MYLVRHPIFCLNNDRHGKRLPQSGHPRFQSRMPLSPKWRIRPKHSSYRIPPLRGLETITSLRRQLSSGFPEHPFTTRKICASHLNLHRRLFIPYPQLSIKWDLIGHVWTRPSQLNMRGTAPSGGLFANTLRYHEKTKTFYAITTWFDIINPPDVSAPHRSHLCLSKL